MTWIDPSFPPLLSGRAVVKGDDPRVLAIAGAASGSLGAGDTLWLQDTTRAALAIVLEPDDPLTKSAQMLPLGVAAAGDCLGALTPPQVAVQYRWPATLLLNGAAAGHCSLTAPRECAPSQVPAWMVLTFELSVHLRGPADPGLTPGITSLAEEGGEELTAADVLESYARHFLSTLDTWTNEGFAPIATNWEGRLERRGETVEIAHPSDSHTSTEGAPRPDAGTAPPQDLPPVGQTSLTALTLGLDEDGNLLVKPTGASQTRALPLIDCLARAAPASPAPLSPSP